MYVSNGKIILNGEPVKSWNEIPSHPVEDWALRREIGKEVETLVGINFYRLYQLAPLAGLELDEISFSPNDAEAIMQQLVSRAADNLVWLDLGFRQEQWAEQLENRLLEKIAARQEARKAGSVVVAIPVGDTQWGGYQYGIDLVSPEGKRFDLLRGGANDKYQYRYSQSGPLWEKYRYSGPYSGPREEVRGIEVVPDVKIDGKMFEVDVVHLPTEDKKWRWRVYKPWSDWQICAGSVAFMDRCIRHAAQIS